MLEHAKKVYWIISGINQSKDEDLGRCDVDRRFAGVFLPLEGLGQAPRLAQQSEGALYYPTAMLDCEAPGARQLGNDLHGPAKLLLDPPRHRLAARVCPHVPQPLTQGFPPGVRGFHGVF